MLGSVLGAAAATGPDVSNWNHPNGVGINWGQVRAAGNTFAFVKATQGPSVVGGSFYTNPWYATDSVGAAAAGLYVGSYDFAVPAMPYTTATLQARAFVSVTGSLHHSWQLPPVLDLEETGGLSSGYLVAWVQTWLTEAQRLTGRVPMIYTSPNFWKTYMGNTTSLRGYRLWVASWTSAPTPGPLPGGWSTWTMWQYTDAANVPGITGGVDLSRYCCTLGNLAALADGTADQAAGNPFGSFDSATRAPGSITVSGWAIDPDTTSPIGVHVYLDGNWDGQTITGVSRPDVAAAYPGWGNNTGYSVTVPAAPGNHQVCIYAINVGNGTSNPLLGCRTVSGAPVGALSSLTPIAGGVQVQGWVDDPDTTTPASVDVYVDGRHLASAPGQPQSYSVAVGDMTDGTHQICVYGIDTQHLQNSLLGCRNVTVTGAPFGHLDSVVSADGQLTVTGWAIDPNTTAPIRVDIYVDRAWASSATAGMDRPDVGQAFIASGPMHGFDQTLTIGPGTHTVCAYAINVGLGASNPSIGCQTVS